MEPYQIVLLIVVFVGFFYIALVTFVVGQMIEFRQRLNRRLKGLNLLLYERGEAVLDLYALFESEGVEFQEEDKESRRQLEALSYKQANEKSVREEAEIVKTATSRIRYLSGANRWARQHESYKDHMDLLQDLERNYRTVTGAYNSDVGGYNYWIGIPTVSWIGFLFGFRKKSNIN